MAPKNVKNALKTDSDDETSSVVPVNATKNKRIMTPEMLEVLRLARLKSLQTKKALAEGGVEKRLEFYTEKVIREKEKQSVSKKGLKARAVAEVAGEILPELPVVVKKPIKVKPVVPEIKPVVPDVPVLAPLVGVPKTVSIPESVLATLIARLDSIKPVVAPVPNNTGSIPEVVAPVPVVEKKKKKVKYVYEETDSGSEGEDRVVVVKKKEKEVTTKAVPKALEQRAQNLINPSRANSYNIFGQRRY